MEKYLVTGGAGFIGSNIVEELAKRNHKVRVLDNFITGKRENLAPFLKNIELIEGDIRDINAVRKSVKGIDYVLHQAALRSVPKSVDNPVLTNDINVNGTLNIFIAAKEAGVKRVVYASSSSVYGDCKIFPEKENFIPRPISPYAVSKLTGEYYGYTFTKTFNLEVVSLRYFNVFGPRQNPESKYSAVIPAFISHMLSNKAPIIEGSGKQSRDFTYVENVVLANLAACKAKNAAGEIFNVACNKSYSVLDIIKYLDKFLGKKTKPEYVKARMGDVRKTIADITKMKRILKLTPKVQFEEGLKRTLNWFREDTGKKR
ncbi:MAG: SDR family oxidoreductase [Candidatus Omnitrophica bacterium]|nr:SDR family oxidoreductase [Candidatus Omnitrophota bacterium]MBU4487473.1 SDR family oxidoreductase [Candidatus Omnitrophota bacterium]MCG2705119.1 SDR family oxidoreductase [Candidatus Omnitrophota bacterium]